METDSGASVSIWVATADIRRAPPLAGSVRADVCVVGAGIAGLTTAYMLAREGQSVVVLDDGPIGGGETSRTTAHLAIPDEDFSELVRLQGDEGARRAIQSHLDAIDQIEAIAGEEQIQCELERLDGYLFMPPGESVQHLSDELAIAHRLGFKTIEQCDRAPIENFDTRLALRFPRQAQFHPIRYLAGLLKAFEKRGGRVFGDTRAEQFEGGKGARVVTREGHTISCDAIVVATNSPVNDRVAIHTKQHPYRTYAVGLRVPAGGVEPALYWDTADPYHYVRVQRVEEGQRRHAVLIVGGEDHHTGQANDAEVRWQRLERWARERWPSAEDREFQWSGQVLEPVDGLAFIGRNPLDHDNVFIATGDSGNGLTHGMIAGSLITDLILGRENPYETLYDPARRSLRAIKEWVVEAATSTAPLVEWLTGGYVGSVDEIPLGEGAIIRRGLGKVAVFRRRSGEVVELSAVCPHLGCIVAWNSSEKSWDCPCHGSRFNAEGRVVNGPAVTDLSSLGK